MPFKSGDFDFIIALAMVYYLSLDAFLKEANRLLISEGKLLFCTSNKDVPGFVKAPFTTQYYSIPELRDLLHAAGFKVSFFGAFPSRRGSLHKHRIKATFKNIAKNNYLFPGGKIFWEKIRNSTLKDLKPLPGDILKMPKYSGGRYLLSQDDPNTLYRVIYVVAKKLKQMIVEITGPSGAGKTSYITKLLKGLKTPELKRELFIIWSQTGIQKYQIFSQILKHRIYVQI